MKLGHHNGKKVTEPDLKKKSCGSQSLENPPFWDILDVLCSYPGIKSSKVSVIS